ncbi:hypothetical protein J6590_016766 [Homalodisca vitripennis]|nr:hypothetical protein J6590_016766 [Homalodisca vitripennis]
MPVSIGHTTTAYHSDPDHPDCSVLYDTAGNTRCQYEVIPQQLITMILISAVFSPDCSVLCDTAVNTRCQYEVIPQQLITMILISDSIVHCSALIVVCCMILLGTLDASVRRSYISRHYCGSDLSNALSVLCDGNYKRSDLPTNINTGMYVVIN